MLVHIQINVYQQAVLHTLMYITETTPTPRSEQSPGPCLHIRNRSTPTRSGLAKTEEEACLAVNKLVGWIQPILLFYSSAIGVNLRPTAGSGVYPGEWEGAI